MRSIVLVIGLFGWAFAWSAPFNTCPSKAFLVQDTTARLYGVNLVTGSYQQLSGDLGTTGKINGFGFSFHDQYLYGWGYEYGEVIRIGNDFQVERLPVASLPQTNFFVGDVALASNHYYVYKKGADFGLFRISLDPLDGQYLNAVRIVDGSTLNLSIFDLAFHPYDSFAYSVDNRGRLWQIDVETGAAVMLANVGESGTFGAVYFDVDGWLYISRNSDGSIFRIDLEAASPTAEFFAFGPASSNNDGARCAIAPLLNEDVTNIDFGDAPDSYGTTLAANGARHEIVAGGLFMGAAIDGEAQPAIAPFSDDAAGTVNDEDGVWFATPLTRGLDGVVVVTASADGYLSAWVDVDQNGSFDADDQLVTDLPVSAGQNPIALPIPLNATNGNSWARFRISDQIGLGPTGGVVNGEVEDYPVNISGNGIITSAYPSMSQWNTLAYEDNWPERGDYDQNDVVVQLRIITRVSSDGVEQVELKGQIAAVGGDYHNGFAVRLPGIASNNIDPDSVIGLLGNKQLDASVVEAGREEAIIIVSSDIREEVDIPAGCGYFRTEANCQQSQPLAFHVSFQFATAVPVASFPAMPLDPFIFATPGTYHGDLMFQPGRGWEVHLKNQSPTEAFDAGLWGLGDDASNPGSEHYFQDVNGMPWALSIDEQWLHPLERVDLIQAYPRFVEYVQSLGVEARDWHQASQRVNGKTVQN